MTTPAGPDDETTLSTELDEPPAELVEPPAELDEPPAVAAADAEVEDDAEAEDDEDADESPPAPRRVRQLGAILAVIAGFLLGWGLFLPLVRAAGTDTPGLNIDISKAGWLISLSNLALPFLVVVTGLAVLAEFMRSSVGAGVVITASLATLLSSAAVFQYIVMDAPKAQQLAFASGFYVLAIGSLMGLASGVVLLAASRRSAG